MEESKQDYKFHDLIVVQNKLSLSMCAFLDLTDFDTNQYFSSSFWCELNALGNHEWFDVPDYIIERVGYKGTAERMDSIRSNLFSFIKRKFIENVDYKFIHLKKFARIGSGGNNKLRLEMKRDSFKMLLMKASTQYSDQIYRYLITFEQHVKQYHIYQNECNLFRMSRLIEQVQAPPLNKFQLNCMKRASYKGYVYVATSKNYAKNDLYKIGHTDKLKKRKIDLNSSHVRNDDIIYYAYTVESHDAKSVEALVHSQLEAFQYKECDENSAREWYLFPLDSIIQIIDFVVEKYDEIYDFSETIKNEVLNY